MRDVFWQTYWSEMQGVVATGNGSVLPKSENAARQMLELFILDKACYELGYELNNRPDWIQVPLLRDCEFVVNR